MQKNNHLRGVENYFANIILYQEEEEDNNKVDQSRTTTQIKLRLIKSSCNRLERYIINSNTDDKGE